MGSTVTDRITGLSTSVAVKAPVEATTTDSITLSGLGVQAGGTWNAELSAGDRILVKNQDDAKENGIYTVFTSEWRRAKDFDGYRDVVKGTSVALADSGDRYLVSAENPIVIGSSDITFIPHPDDFRVMHLSSISELISVDSSVDGSVYSVTGYHAGSEKGGGRFYWDASKPKSRHNGGEIIDPDKTFPTDWTDRAQLYSWFDGTGSTGAGCFVAILDDLRVNLMRYGCYGSGTNDDSVQVQRGLYDAVQSSRVTYAPAGTYLKGFNLDGNCPFSGSRWYEFEFPVDAFAGIEGDGVGATEFKVADGLITARGRFTFTFGILEALNTNTPKVIHQRNYTINQNGSNNPLNPGDGLFEFEQAHCFSFDKHEDGFFENIKIKDAVGGGLVHSAKASRFDVYKSITWSDFSGNFGRRSDIEIQGFPRLAVLDECYVDAFQTEPNSLNPDGFHTVVQIIGGSIPLLDLAGVGNRSLTTFVLDGLEAMRSVRLSSSLIYANNCQFLVRASEQNQYINSRLNMRGGRLLYEVEGGDINTIYPRNTEPTEPMYWSFKGVKFEIDSDDSAFTPSGNGRAFSLLATTASSTVANYLEFDEGCEFDPRFKQIADVYRSYQLVCKNSKIRCSGQAFRVGTDRDGLQKVTLQNNDWSEFSGTSVLDVTLTAGNAPLFSLEIDEKMPASRWAVSGSGAANLEGAGSYNVNVELIGDTEVTSGKIHGVRQYRQTPTDAEWYLKAYRAGVSVNAVTLP